MEQKQNIKKNFFVIGIGASAGGLRALEEFFDNMPNDSGAAFVVIQHLSPDFKSLMKELLERRTKMSVFRAEDGMELEANNIYLIPHHNNLVVEGTVLHLIEQEEGYRNRPNFPIDVFFKSLGKSWTHYAMGVILSGTGSDGSRGLQAINQLGGTTFVQSPATAEFDGMLQTAIATGIIDHIASPKDLAAIIYDLVITNEKGKTSQPDSIGEINEIYQKKIIEILKESEKVDFSYYKSNTLSRRIVRRSSLSGCNQIEDYIEKLRESKEERAFLKDDLLIGVTRFFRDPEVWEYLEEIILPEIISNLEKGDELKVWVSACATGEEAYSIAILISEILESLERKLTVKIFATDIDSEALNIASERMYPESIAQDIPHPRLEKYFTHAGSEYTAKRKIREMIIFTPHNLIKNVGFSKMNLILCRNVLIYMQPQLQQQVLRMLHFSLNSKGILCLGKAETLGELEQEFIPLNEKWKIFRKRRNVRIPLYNPPLELTSRPITYTPFTSQKFTNTFDPLLEEAFATLIKESNQTCLIIDRSNKLIHYD